MSNQVTGEQPNLVPINSTIFPVPEFLKTSFLTTGRLFTGVRLWLDPHQAVEANFSYAPASLSENGYCPLLCGESNILYPLRAFFVAGNYVHELPSVWRARPFLTAGLGGVRFFQPGFVMFSGNHFTANFGGGLDFRLSRHWVFRAEYRDWILAMPQTGEGSPGGLTHNSVPSIGLAYRF